MTVLGVRTTPIKLLGISATITVLTYSFFFLPLTVRAQNVPPILICIAHYESDLKQFGANGSPLWSPTGDVGILQINYKDWHGVAQAHGWDFVHSEEDNISMALYIYKVMGPKAWATYSKCKALDTS